MTDENLTNLAMISIESELLKYVICLS